MIRLKSGLGYYTKMLEEANAETNDVQLRYESMQKRKLGC